MPAAGFQGSFPSHARNAPGIRLRAGERNFISFLLDVVLPGTLERRSERPREAARRPRLRAETEAPAPPQSAPRAHSDCDLETIEEKRAKSSFRAKRTHTLRHSLQLEVQTSCSLYFTDWKSTPKSFTGGGGGVS